VCNFERASGLGTEAASDERGAAVGSINLPLGEKTGWFRGLGYRYFGARPLTEGGAFFSPATGHPSIRACGIDSTTAGRSSSTAPI